MLQDRESELSGNTRSWRGWLIKRATGKGGINEYKVVPIRPLMILHYGLNLTRFAEQKNK